LQAGKTSSPANNMATIIRISAVGIFDLLLDAPHVIVQRVRNGIKHDRTT